MRMSYIYTLSITISLLTITLLLYNFEPTFLSDAWTLITSIIGIASAAGTIVAAFATLQAAKEAAKSAKIAKKSMKASVRSSNKILQETQNSNRRSNFESRYALLLAQHDNYHRQVCDYIDAWRKENAKEVKLILNDEDKKAIHDFFNISLLADSLKPCMAFLTGHEIISRYMRILYHLLKFVHSEFYYNNTEPESIQIMKNYTSPLRSTIRNDVLCMIAVNALNINSDNAINSGYPHYQKLLHTFDFFEHAVFLSPFEPNIFGNEKPEEKIHELVRDKQSKYIYKLVNNKEKIFKEPTLQRFSPTILCLLIYKNPMKLVTETALHTLFDTIKSSLENITKNHINDYKKSTKIIKNLEQCQYQICLSGDIYDITPEIIAELKNNAEEVSNPVNNYTIHVPESLGMGFTICNSDYFHNHFKEIIRYDGLFQELQKNGSISEFLKYKQRQHDESLDEFYSQIQKYRVA
ncbi:hypothetical protein WP5W18E06_22890 [Klebsiella quasipneumoniae]|uniref:putative phage abortive infection protein n=1 Tax=Klebsiella quasipneumoniae TaxID=1463165 RepID=UPI00128E06DF|nr:putative phage abortive infection protein [Klebsiella quasipneumoniae]MBC4671746.1 hypothetical protein [Klebsiella quasipneumoniae]MPU36544.1 hypothetical protein [Klebsiella quasipneumoniae]BBS21752.1 hypothetical protein WP5W18E06_22890 [Klebsiella quasipneumoniae]HEN5148080.1 hypothetical protein [Klebsiella quasipneumoniae subsp. similipneumoniae]